MMHVQHLSGSTCSQGRCGQCRPGSGVMSDLFLFFNAPSITLQTAACHHRPSLPHDWTAQQFDTIHLAL